MVDRVVHRHNLRDELIRITDLLTNRGTAAEARPDGKVARLPRAKRPREPANDEEQRPAAE
jgi:hypothetical protein